MIDIDTRIAAQMLGRQARPVLTDETGSTVRNGAVLITGAGGSIGSELARQVAACGPRALTLLEQSEYQLFRIEADIRARHPGLVVHAVLGDVTVPADVRAAFVEQPELVLHAAAYKHVTMAERAIVAAARVNVLGTALVCEAARKAGAHLVLVSTDKAAEPASVMGATKRFAEMLVLEDASASTAVVRFGNVLGSSGSVLELMMRAALRGEPIPVTQPSATRYFMTASEAVSLVLTAGCARGDGDVFWVDMGEPIRIGDLAARVEQWAREAGHEPAGIRIIGLRAGEKLDEQLTTHGLEMTRTANPHVWTARQPPLDRAAIAEALQALRTAVAAGSAAGVLEALVDGVPDFIPAADTCARVLPADHAPALRLDGDGPVDLGAYRDGQRDRTSSSYFLEAA